MWKAGLKKSAWYVALEVTTMYASHKDWLDKVIEDNAVACAIGDEERGRVGSP